MGYNITITVPFACPPREVYEALSNLTRYPDWIDGMTSVTPAGHMHPGLLYITETQVLGRTNRSKVLVREMVADKLIVTESQAGLVEFVAKYHIEDQPGGHSLLNLELCMSFSPAPS